MPLSNVRREQVDRIAIVAGALFWAMFVALYTLRAALAAPGVILGGLGPRLEIALFGALLSWTMYRVVETIPVRAPIPRLIWAIAVAIPTAILFAFGDAVAGGVIRVNGTFQCPGTETACSWWDVWILELDNSFVWIFLFSAWGILHVMLRSMVEGRAADERAHAEREAARLAEIRALRYQINPHFLFNCLNSLTALVRRKDVTQAEEMIGDLGQFIRFSLTVDPIADVSLDSEVEMQIRYLELERRRFPNRMQLAVEVDPPISGTAVPPLILQPLVENAVKHGVDNSERPVTISVTARHDPPGFVTIVVNNRSPSPVKAPEKEAPGFGIGLENVRARLAARFGDAATFSAGPLVPGEYRAELCIPITALEGQ